MINVYESVDANRVKSAIIIGLFTAFVFAVVYLLGISFGYGQDIVVIAVLFSVLSSIGGFWFSDRIVLTISSARPADEAEDKMFRSVTQNVCQVAQLPMPKLYVIEDSAPNAFATGRNPKHAVVCVTTGLLTKLTRTELEAVVAHELSHIRNYDMLLMSLVAIMVGTLTLLADWLLRSNIRSRDDDDRGSAGSIMLIVGFLLALLSPIIAQLIQLAVSRRREFLADAGSAFLTRQPSGLISALQKIEADSEPLEAANKATAHLYFASPFKSGQKSGGWFISLFNTHPPVSERISALEGMS